MTNQTTDEFRGDGRFRLRRRIGSGGFGIVYEAFDTRRNAVVALKTLRAFDAAALHKFKQEFRTLADVDHVHLVSLYELFGEGDEWFFTMELVDGVPLTNYVWDAARPLNLPSMDSQSPTSDSPAISVRAAIEAAQWAQPAGPTGAAPVANNAKIERLRSVMRQLAEGLCAIHQAGILHRDIKPSNVLVRPEGLVVVLDFGLATDLSGRGSEGRIVGTPAYMSPEQASGRFVDEASDWYSVGVMLYEGLTGQSPFRGRTSEVLLSKQFVEPPPPHDIAHDIPEDLDRLCQDLLRIYPGDRPTGAEVLRRLNGEPCATPNAPQAETTARTPSSLVGRDAQLAALLDAHTGTAREDAVVACIEGRSGMGKSALARRFLRTVQQQHPRTVVLSGRCYQQESVPYKAIDGVIDELAQVLTRMEPREIEGLLPRNISALARLFPVLRQVGAIAAIAEPSSATDAQELRRRAFAALRELLRAMVKQNPVVLFIDDLHWGDIDSASLLNELLRPPDPPPLLLVIVYRSEERQSSAALNAFLPALAAPSIGRRVFGVAVGELSEDDARHLAADLLANAPNAAIHAEAIARESAGSPFFVEELARFAAASGRIASLGDVLGARVAALSADARLMLELAALNSRPLDFEVGKSAHEWAGDPHAVLRQLRSLHLVRTQTDAEFTTLEPNHDRIREAVVHALDANTRRAHHVRLARAWEASRRADPELLATHYEGAGDPVRAADYAERAAALADEALAFDRAARLYRLVVNLRPGADAADLRPIQIKLAKSLANTGKGRLAAEAYLQAAAGAPEADLVELEREAAEQFLRVGDVDQGLAVMGRVLDRVGVRLPMTSRAALPSLLWNRAYLALRGYGFHERAASEIPAHVLRQIDTCYSATIGTSFVDALRGSAYHHRTLLLALKTGEPFRVARSLTTQTGTISHAGRRRMFARVEALQRRTMELANQLNDDYLRGMTTMNAGMGIGMLGDHKGCLARFEEGTALLRDKCVGAIWEQQGARVFMVECLFWLGNWSELLRRLPGYIQICDEASDHLTAAFMKARARSFALLFANEPQRAREDAVAAIAQWANQPFNTPKLYELFAQLYVDLYTQDSEAGFDRLKRNQRDLSRSLVLQVQKFRVEFQMVRGCFALIAAARGNTQMLKMAEQDARRLAAEDIPWAEALAVLLKAGIASTRGEREHAVTLLTNAERLLEACELRAHLAAARRRRGELIGGDEGRSLIEASNGWMTAQQVVDPARMTDMLAPGRWR